jgi:hypothetical protein
MVARDEWKALPFWKRLEIRFHLMMCVHCRRYVEQIKTISEAARRSFAHDSERYQQEIAELEERIMRDFSEGPG